MKAIGDGGRVLAIDYFITRFCMSMLTLGAPTLEA